MMQPFHTMSDFVLGEVLEGSIAAEPMLQLFKFGHLSDTLRPVSRVFALAALETVDRLPRNPERTACLRKLREAKDCAITGMLWK